MAVSSAFRHAARWEEHGKGKRKDAGKEKKNKKFCFYLCASCTEDLRLDRNLIMKVCKKPVCGWVQGIKPPKQVVAEAGYLK